MEGGSGGEEERDCDGVREREWGGGGGIRRGEALRKSMFILLRGY